MSRGDEEYELLGELADLATPTALVMTRVDRYPDWPGTAARLRDAVDPGRRLAVFAVSSTGGGVDDLADWCATADTDASVPVRPPTPVTRLGPAVRPAPLASGPSRADRLTGLRAGVAAARTDALTAARESLQSLAVRADRVCSGLRPADVDAYIGWVTGAVAAVETTIDARLADRLDKVRSVASAGLPDEAAVDVRPVPAVVSAPAPPERRPSAEDAVVLLFGVSAGFGAGRVLVAPMVQWAGLGWAGAVLTAATGLAVAAWIVGVRRTAATRTALRKWTSDIVVLRRTALEHRLIARIGLTEAGVGRAPWNRRRPNL
ncbi:hypothetical protein ACFOJ6_06640 [Gordonia humi]|uniref:hypothetical protein n=1 Tax=Gordonia humi TaxID=686429 RepID=UPI0036162149